MRGAILMCLFVICAALSMHYMQAAEKAQAANGRSDPLVAFDHAFPTTVDEQPSTQPASTLTSAGDFDE